MTGVQNEPTRAAPIVKAVGGKTKLLGELVARMPPRFGRYFEPFAGGAALFFRVAPARAVLADANADLIATYIAVVEDVHAVIAELEQHGRLHSEQHFAAVKARWNARVGADQSERAAMFVYMNKTGFNGLWRVNQRGEFNVGWGQRKAYAPDGAALRAAAAVLRRCDGLIADDFRTVLEGARRGDFVYLDSPYDDTFTSYTAWKFSAVDQAEVAFAARTLAARGVQVMVSNADTPRVRALYAGMRIDVVQAPRAINCDGKGRGKVDEVIVTAGYKPDDAAIARLAAERNAVAKNKRRVARAKGGR